MAGIENRDLLLEVFLKTVREDLSVRKVEGLVRDLATSPKSNSAYKAIDAAIAEVRTSGHLPVPLHLRNSPTKLMKQLGYGQEYKYAHDFEGNFVDVEFLPDKIKGKQFYFPQNNRSEQSIWARLQQWWKKYK